MAIRRFTFDPKDRPLDYGRPRISLKAWQAAERAGQARIKTSARIDNKNDGIPVARRPEARLSEEPTGNRRTFLQRLGRVLGCGLGCSFGGVAGDAVGRTVVQQRMARRTELLKTLSKPTGDGNQAISFQDPDDAVPLNAARVIGLFGGGTTGVGVANFLLD